MPVLEIRKRGGRIVQFKKEKIADAVRKAAKDVKELQKVRPRGFQRVILELGQRRKETNRGTVRYRQSERP